MFKILCLKFKLMRSIAMLLVVIPTILSLTACRVRLVEPEQAPQENIYQETETPIIDPLSELYIAIPIEHGHNAYSPGSATPPAIADPGDIIITVESPMTMEGETTLDDDGEGTLGLIIDRYTGLLNSGLGSLFDCQRLYVYVERLTPFETINRNSPEHTLITQSGGHNVAARRGNDALIVDAEWLQRRNPAIFIRIVDASTLGANIISPAAAQATRNEIISREGLANITAILHRRIVLLSEELLATDEGRLIAKLHIANAMYPSLFADINLAEMHEHIRDAGGPDFTRGIFVH